MLHALPPALILRRRFLKANLGRKTPLGGNIGFRDPTISGRWSHEVGVVRYRDLCWCRRIFPLYHLDIYRCFCPYYCGISSPRLLRHCRTERLSSLDDTVGSRLRTAPHAGVSSSLWKTIFPDVTLHQVYRYGTSVKYQRIESWWRGRPENGNPTFGGFKAEVSSPKIIEIALYLSPFQSLKMKS